MSIIAYPLEATQYTASDVQTYLSTRTSGVFSEEITLTPEGMTATISPFLAWFNYAKFKGCSVAVTEPETVTFSPAHAVLDRIDRVVLRLDLTLNKAYLHVIEGFAASGAVPPDISTSEVIHDISPFTVRIRAGATEITPADITSTIPDEEVCGIMRDGVTGIPTAQLQAQAEELIERLQEAISEVEANSAFMMGSVYDPENKAKPVAFEDEVFLQCHPVGSIITTRGISENPNKRGGVWEIINTKSDILLKQYITISEPNTVYEHTFDVSKYYISREDYNITAIAKSGTPQGVSLSYNNVEYDSLSDGSEYIKSFSIAISRNAAVNTWVHARIAGTCLLGMDLNIPTSAAGTSAFVWERVE